LATAFDSRRDLNGEGRVDILDHHNLVDAASIKSCTEGRVHEAFPSWIYCTYCNLSKFLQILKKKKNLYHKKCEQIKNPDRSEENCKALGHNNWRVN
jgi:hypothetical protein